MSPGLYSGRSVALDRERPYGTNRRLSAQSVLGTGSPVEAGLRSPCLKITLGLKASRGSQRCPPKIPRLRYSDIIRKRGLWVATITGLLPSEVS